jgi:hypothetical protein
MDRIASPQRLAHELGQLLTYTQGPTPSREIIANRLRDLAAAMEAPVPSTRTAEYKGEGEQMFELLDAEYNTVNYDPDKGSGWADIGTLGRITFNESGSDPAVVVIVSKPLRIKGRPKDVMEALETVAKAIDIY